MSGKINSTNWARFACALSKIRKDFPEHSKEIDKCVFDVGQKLEHCNDPNCSCRMSFKNFRAIANQNAHEEI